MIIITGGAGFIGSATVHRLNSSGITDLLLIDNPGGGSKWKNLTNLRFADLIHKSKTEQVLRTIKPRRVEGVIHLGACSSTTETDMNYLLENNYRQSVLITEWCLRHKIKLIYASSAATYGNGTAGFDDTQANIPLLKPLNPYGFSKQLFDRIALQRGWLNRITGLKFFNVYGPNEYHKGAMQSLVPVFYRALQAEEPMKLFKSYNAAYRHGEQERDFIYIKDVTAVIEFFLENPQQSGVFNVGTGQPAAFNRLAHAAAAALQQKPRIEYIEMPENLRGQYQYTTCANIDRLRRAGYNRPFFTVEEGCADYINNYLSAEDPCLGNSPGSVISPRY